MVAINSMKKGSSEPNIINCLLLSSHKNNLRQEEKAELRKKLEELCCADLGIWEAFRTFKTCVKTLAHEYCSNPLP